MAEVSGSSSTSGMKREGNFGGWLQRVRRTGEFSDIVVRINGTTDFNLHTLPLRNGSSFFRDLHSSKSSSQEENLVDIALLGGPEAFSAAADFCYLIKPVYTPANVAPIRSVAQQLGMPELLDSTKKFLYSNVFSHWKSCAAFLHHYTRFGDPAVDLYIETRCIKVIASACTKAFSETKHVSVPIPPAASVLPPVIPHGAQPAALGDYWPTPCSSLTEVLATVTGRLPDVYMKQLVDSLVEAEVNLSLKCRQGRNVRAWVRYLIRDECRSDSSRRWVLVCLSEMLLRSSSPVPRMELSSQYWCSLLEHIEEQVQKLTSEASCSSNEMLHRLRGTQSQLEQRIGAKLHELDDYLHSYRFSAPTLLSLVRHFVHDRDEKLHQEQLEEVATEVDGCLWAFAENPASISPDVFVAIFATFPGSCRPSHDPLFAAVDRMLCRRGEHQMRLEEIENLWGLVDCDKLSAGVHEQAMNNPSFVCQPRVLERVLRMHSEELAAMGEGEDRQKLRNIMHKVIKASLKLLEENSRRSKEILELQSQYTALLGGRTAVVSGSSCENSPDSDVFHKTSAVVHPEAVEEEDFDEEEEEEVDSMDEDFHQQHQQKNKDEEHVVVEAPQTPMVEARRSLHCMSANEIFAA